MTIYRGTNLVAGVNPNSSENLDNTTTTLNASNKIQASGFIDKHSNTAK